MALRGPFSIVRHRYFLPVVGGLTAIAALWVFGRPRPDIERVRRHFVDVEQRRVVAQQSRPRVDWREFWRDSAAVRRAVLAEPLVALPGAPPIPDVLSVYSVRREGCASCHVAVATPGFEGYPEPFRTHVQLSSYVGADSPHPPSRMECTQCHLGDPGGETFSGAGHSTLRPSRASSESAPGSTGDGAVRHVLFDSTQWRDERAQGAMLPTGRTAAGCRRCHAGERYQPGASALNDAVATADRAGCYGCHRMPGLERVPKRGPDLRRIGGKLTREWVRQWLAEPSAIKPSTWMPSVWPAPQTQTSADRAEIDAVVAYLFARADEYAPSVAVPPRGDATRGQRLVDTLGCLGCHIVGDTERDSVGATRTFGPPLQALGSKTTDAWLYDWLREPTRYSPTTRMPQLRLSDTEAADIATFLLSLTRELPAAGPTSDADDAAYRAVLGRFPVPGAPAADAAGRLTGDALKVAAGRAVIQARGCDACHAISGVDAPRTLAPVRDVEGEDRHLRRRASAAAPLPSASARGSDRDEPQTAQDLARPAFVFGQAEWERIGLAVAVAARTGRDDRSISVPWHLAKSNGRSVLLQHNCLGCHDVEGAGDVSSAVPGGGDAPRLTDIAARMTLPALRERLRRPAAASDGRGMRMPSFALTDDEIAVIGGYLQAVAPNNQPLTKASEPRQQ